MAKNSKLPSVLAFEKKLVPSDGRMYGVKWEDRTNEEKAKALTLIEKSVRGTISNRLSKEQLKDPAKIDAAVDKANLQRVDTCCLDWESDTLKLQFTLKILAGVETPSVCNNADFLKTYTQSAKQYIEEEGFADLGKRYALNIANGRFLWRNRVGVENIEVQVKNDDHLFCFDSLEHSLNDFETDNAEVISLGKIISDVLCGKKEFVLLEITAFSQLGKGQDVYPSEELVLDKGTTKKEEKKSKILYEVDGIAGMHSQKLGNALRTIDTWYPDYGVENMNPIAIEPYGAVTTLGRAFRTNANKADFYTLFDQFGVGEKLSTLEERNYVMAVCVRGGVFGESSKE